MLTELNNFAGGINNWLEPYAIGPSQAVALSDAEVASGAIHAARGSRALSYSPPEILSHLTPTRSLVKFGATTRAQKGENQGLGLQLRPFREFVMMALYMLLSAHL